jgi:hypothetical protein
MDCNCFKVQILLYAAGIFSAFKKHTGDGQIMETFVKATLFSLKYGVGLTFASNTACIPLGIDSY